LTVVLIAEALTDVATMKRFLDRVGATSTDDDDFLAECINACSLACARYANRQFTPERTPQAGAWPLISDTIATGQTKTFTYRGGGYLDLSPWEPRTVTTIVMNTDLPTANQVTLFNGDSTREAEYRLEPAQKTVIGTYEYAFIPGYDYGPGTPLYDYTSQFSRRNGRRVTITGDWGAPVGMVPEDVKRACQITVADWFRNPEGYAQRSVGGMDVVEQQPAHPGSLLPESRALLGPYRRP
jgi:hypothetical protein